MIIEAIKKKKKTISPVVAIALLLVVSVLAVVGFQSWFQTYSSSTFTNVEIQSQSGDNVDIQGIVGNSLYIKKSNDENECLNVVGNYSDKIIELNVSDCLENLSTSTPEIVVHSKNNILQESDFIKNSEILNNLIINTPLPIPTNGLIAEYLFEDGLDLGKDTSGNGNGASVFDFHSQMLGIVGDGIYFNGVDDYITSNINI